MLLNACAGPSLGEGLKMMALQTLEAFDPTIDRGFSDPEDVYKSLYAAGLAQGPPSMYGADFSQESWFLDDVSDKPFHMYTKEFDQWKRIQVWDPRVRQWRNYRSYTEYLNGIE